MHIHVSALVAIPDREQLVGCVCVCVCVCMDVMLEILHEVSGIPFLLVTVT